MKGIADLTLWVGNFTVLPHERGIRANLKENINRATRGKFGEMPPGLLGESKGSKKDSKNQDGHQQKNDPESAAQRVAGDKAGAETAQAEKQGEGDDQLPKSRRQYHLVLAKEIGKVMKHLNSSPPRKYTFDEWAWYLKLIGEDESSPDTHRKPKRKPKADGEGLGAALDGADVEGNKDMRKEWSWIGNRSPLMGNKEESEVSQRISTISLGALGWQNADGVILVGA